MDTVKGARHKLCRRVGYCLYDNPKCPSKKRPYPAGSRKVTRRARKSSDYGKQLLEKQKLKNTYVMRERPFRRFFELASHKRGAAGNVFLTLLESRLDNVVYRLGFATNILDGRQLVGHGHILINGEKVDIPSCIVKPGSKITLTEKAREFVRVKEAVERKGDRPDVPYVKADADKLSGVFTGIGDISDVPNKVELSQVVEFYSR